jgi:RimJ/RimL family protein N-acetyltransferase
MRAELTVRPIGTRPELARVIEYFHSADDTALMNMGVDRALLPDPRAWLERLCRDLNLDNRERQTFFVSWMNGGQPIGHSNINKIAYGDQAYAHLHLWNKVERASGFGEILMRQSLEVYFQKFALRRILCEPYAENPGPNRLLAKLGFRLVKRYRTVPGVINFDQEVNLWQMDAGDLAERA